ncbi:hypothetical protein A8F94_00275 [Bacillus sp. FJAT-27225]|uniref:hypothetical protein n=1 Tax=Bacillus sp. FJAT-27225 TaxID=1743144 RepID=UPI00080C21D6|nr:hypothetical protein [Bacillus sp. FJAT-27225]OCA90369.1 hypothetical protein A8F94_00275 [Bacillus sp. FJAT-27225]
MKKFLTILLGLVGVIVIVIGYVQYKLISTEKAVFEYLTVNKNLPEETITIQPFIANLSGDKNWMVSVTIKGDSYTYYYFLNGQNKIVLESVDKNGEGDVLNQIMN